ncbi:MAG TPA: PHB depolymerase family esterase [Propionibacteriaceae bacterium]
MSALRIVTRAATAVAAVGALLIAGSSAVAAPGTAARSDTSDASGGGGGGPGSSCSRSLPAGVQTVQVAFGGASYPVRVYVPDGVKRTKSLPLVLDLHGSSSNGVAQAPISDLTAVAAREKFIVANPSGAIALPQPNPPLPDGSWAWNVPGVPTTAGQFPPAGARDDVRYLAAVIAQLDRTGCVDDRRVYAAGFSGGGRMASALACARADLIAAIAPVAGLRAGRPSPIDTTVPEIQSCTPERPVSVITFHGDADLVNPITGSADLRWGYAVSLAVQTWARLDGCRVGPTAETVSEHVTRFTYSRCRSRTEVTYYRVTGGGHTWPGTEVDLSPLGVTTQEIDASELMWQFFEEHPRRR